MHTKETIYLSAEESDLQIAAAYLRQGKTVIFPTETVYGLGADALDAEAAEKIFSAKGRPSDNPLIVHIAKREDILPLIAELPPIAEVLMDAFWPGPLTMIFKKSDRVPDAVTGGLNTVAIRMPCHPAAHRLLELTGIPIAAPSANISGKPSPTAFEHVKDDMDGRVDAIIDGGSCQNGVESTVLDLTTTPPTLYRPGSVTLEEIESLIGKVAVVTKIDGDKAPKSPGLKYKHYAPNAEVRILRGSDAQISTYAKELSKNGRVALLTFEEQSAVSDLYLNYSLGSKRNPEQAANRLFFALRALDQQGAAYILAPEIPENGVWRAVRNRLYRAAGETLIDLTEHSTGCSPCNSN